MAQFNVHDAKSTLSRLLEMVEEGAEVIVAPDGVPGARLVPMDPPKGLLGSGASDPNYRDLPDDELFAPMRDEDLAAWYDGEQPR